MQCPLTTPPNSLTCCAHHATSAARAGSEVRHASDCTVLRCSAVRAIETSSRHQRSRAGALPDRSTLAARMSHTGLSRVPRRRLSEVSMSSRTRMYNLMHIHTHTGGGGTRISSPTATTAAHWRHGSRVQRFAARTANHARNSVHGVVWVTSGVCRAGRIGGRHACGRRVRHARRPGCSPRAGVASLRSCDCSCHSKQSRCRAQSSVECCGAGCVHVGDHGGACNRRQAGPRSRDGSSFRQVLPPNPVWRPSLTVTGSAPAVES